MVAPRWWRSPQEGFFRTPVAAYSQVTPYRLLTDFPLTAEIRYQPLPDFAVGHVALQCDRSRSRRP